MTLLLSGAISDDDGAGLSSLVYAATKIIPSVGLSERYDSNVFRAPPEFLPPGRKQWDFVTTVAPLVQFQHKTRQMNTTIDAGVSGNVFVNNPELDFISTNLAASSNLDGWVGHLIPGAKLQVSDTFRYTPEPPAFLTGVTPSTTDPFARGIQAFRANTFSNTASVIGAYPLSRTISIRGEYSYSLFRAGSIFFSQTTAGSPRFFDTNLHNWSIGPSFRLTRGDTLSLNYQNTITNLSVSGTSQSFTARRFGTEYSKVTPGWKARVSGGVTVLDPGSVVFFSGGLHFSADYGPSTVIRVAVSRRIAPSFFAISGALISTIAEVSMDYRLSKVLTLTGTVNYGVNETAPVNVGRFTSFTTSARLTYRLTRTLYTSLGYEYNDFRLNRPGTIFEDFDVLRNVVAFSITARWN